MATRRGEVYTIRNPYMKNGRLPAYSLFAEGLHEPLGLTYIKGKLYAAQRSELTCLTDANGDGYADKYETVFSWPLSGNYHEYAYGPVMDKQGNLLITLNLAWVNKEESLSRWDGWMLKIDSNGGMKPFAAGFRSPSGFALNDKGDIFYSENQGGWVGSGGISHVREGDFMGNPIGLNWSHFAGSPVQLRPEDIPDTGEPKYEVAKRIPALKNTAVWFPHGILGTSTSGILSYEGNAKMGPFQGQLFVGDQGQSKIFRVDLEKVNGEYQGVVFPFREGFSSGVLRMVWGSDSSMFIGMTNRGWGSTGKQPFGLQRLEWNGKMPFEIKTIRSRPDGFELEFTQPLNRHYAKQSSSYSITSFTYKYWHEYGSPVIGQQICKIKAIEVSEDGRWVRLVAEGLTPGYIHEIKAGGVRSADNYSLLHDVGYYTLNAIPEGDRLSITASNRVMSAELADHPIHSASSNAAVSPLKASLSKQETKLPSSWKQGIDQAIKLLPVPGLKYNQQSVRVRANSRISLTFKNSDDMPHNVVITLPGAADQIGAMALQMGLDGEKLSYVPESSSVLYHTRLLLPGESQTIYFNAPASAGEYPYICTYPGHYLMMRGVMVVY